MPRRPESRYRREGDCYLIELKLASARRLFNPFDPSPFRDADLDRDAENYIVDAVREFPLKDQLRLVFHLPQAEVDGGAAANVPAAVRGYFDYLSVATARDLSLCLRRGRVSLLIGLAFLFSCVGASELVQVTVANPTLARFLREGLFIIGWVAMWTPIQIFLYDWWPIARRRRIYDKLKQMVIEVRGYR